MFNSAREKARQAACSSNLKQLGIAFLQYAQDNDEAFPGTYAYHFFSDTGNGNSPLEPYIKAHSPGSTETVWLCPDYKKYQFYSVPATPGSTSFALSYASYAMNVFLAPRYTGYGGTPVDPDTCYTQPANFLTSSWNGPTNSNENNLQYDTTNLSGITQAGSVAPAQTDLLFEAFLEGAQPGQTCNQDTYCGQTPKNGDMMNAMGFWDTQAHLDAYYGYATQPGTSPIHTGLNNYLFCDGHVKAKVPEGMNYDIQQHPNDNIWLTHDGRYGGTIPSPPAPNNAC